MWYLPNTQTANSLADRNNQVAVQRQDCRAAQTSCDLNGGCSTLPHLAATIFTQAARHGRNQSQSDVVGAVAHGVNQYHLPRPYQPNPPNKKITTTMIKSVFVSMAVPSSTFAAPRGGIRMWTAVGGDISRCFGVVSGSENTPPPASKGWIHRRGSRPGLALRASKGQVGEWSLERASPSLVPYPRIE
jgi:hypothetical protein